MNVEEEYEDVLQNIEFAIVSVARRDPLLVDFDVENAVNGLIAHYRWNEEGGRQGYLTFIQRFI